MNSSFRYFNAPLDVLDPVDKVLPTQQEQQQDQRPTELEQQAQPQEQELNPQQPQEQEQVEQKLSKKEKSRLKKLEAQVKIESIPSKIDGDKVSNGNSNHKSNGKSQNRGRTNPFEKKSKLDIMNQALKEAKAEAEERSKELEALRARFLQVELNSQNNTTITTDNTNSNDTFTMNVDAVPDSTPVASTSTEIAEVPAIVEVEKIEIPKALSPPPKVKKYLWHDAKTRELNTLLLQLSKDPQFGKTPISWEAITDTLNLNVKSKSKIQVEEVKFRGGGLFSVLEDLNNITHKVYELMTPK